MIADLQSVEAPLGRLEKTCYRLHYVSLGGQNVGLLSDLKARLFAVFANEYTAELRNFIDRCDFGNSSFGSRQLGDVLGVGYCRVVLSGEFVMNLLNDAGACCKLRDELEKILTGGPASE